MTYLVASSRQERLNRTQSLHQEDQAGRGDQLVQVGRDGLCRPGARGLLQGQQDLEAQERHRGQVFLMKNKGKSMAGLCTHFNKYLYEI